MKYSGSSFLNGLSEKLENRVRKYSKVTYVYPFKLCSEGTYFILRSSAGYSIKFISRDGVVREIVSDKVFGGNVVISEIYLSRKDT